MCVRIAEPDEKTRQNTFKCLDILLKTTFVYKGVCADDYVNKLDFSVQVISDNNPESCRKLLEVLL